MIDKSMIALDRVTDYTKQQDGSWHADLRVPRLHVEGESPNDCRYRMADLFEAMLAHWLVTAQKSPRPRLFGDAETETVPTDDGK
jgi:hypothetical protein